MLRFTLHRPSQNSAVSTCCHGMACRDVSGRVHVGVRPVPASHTYEGRLALATLRCDVLAGVTGLRRVRSFHFFDPAGSLLLQPAREQTPPGFKDAPVEPGLLCDVPARILHGSGSGGSHAFDVEVLDPDHVEPGSEVGAGFLKPVFAPVAIAGFQPADQGPDFPAAVRLAPGEGESALQPQEPLSFLRPQTRRAGHLTRGQCHRDSDTPVHADDAAGAGGRNRWGNHGERDMPAARPRVMRYDFQSTRARLRLNDTQPILGTSTLDRARLSCLTRNPAGPTTRKPSSSPALRHVGRLWVPAKNLCPAGSRSRNAGCGTVCEPQASHGSA